MHWSIDSLCEARTAANIEKLKAYVKGMNIRGVMAILILIGLIIVCVQSAFLLRDIKEVNRRMDDLMYQEKRLDLHIEPLPRVVPHAVFEEQEEYEI